jgi:uncharacterized protein (DUF2141 family)
MILFLLLWAIIPALFGPFDAPKKTTLTVTVQNVRSRTGTVRIAVMKPCEKFPSCPPTETAILDARSETYQKAFSLEPGEYAVAVYHDINANSKLDTRMFGIPKEPYGFSNNFRPKFSAPTFKDCQITVGAGEKAITIKVE